MKPPLIKGGQGRSRKDIEEAAKTLLVLMLFAFFLIVVLVIGGQLTS